MSRRGNEDRRVYVGNLHPDARTKDIDEVFNSYGRILDVNLVSGSGRNTKNPFAFVEFEDPRDARDAVERRDGYYFMGRKLRVEFTRGGDRGDRYRRGGDRRGSSVRRTKYRVIVTGLPASASWQDLKDHMRSAGEVAYSDVYKDGSGVVEFLHYDDMRYAIKNLDDTKLKSHEGETNYIRVRAEVVDGDRSSRSRSKSRSRSVSRSPIGNRGVERDPRSESPRPRTPPIEPRRRR